MTEVIGPIWGGATSGGSVTVIWALVYDTMYAMVDRDDDLRVGIKSSAILFGRLEPQAGQNCVPVFPPHYGLAGRQNDQFGQCRPRRNGSTNRKSCEFRHFHLGLLPWL